MRVIDADKLKAYIDRLPAYQMSILQESKIALKELINMQSNIKLTNSEWIDFLCDQFDISRTSSKEMLHAMMLVKKADVFKKQFSGRK